MQHLPKDLVGCPVSKDLPRPVVDHAEYALYLIIGELGEVRALREELTDEDIGVLSSGLLP